MYRHLQNWKEGADDLAYGQGVIIAARWILVMAGLMLAFWNPGEIAELRFQIVLVLGLSVANFYLHSQVLMGKRSIPAVVLGASAADIAVISLIVATQGGFASNLYVFYFPALLALSVTFRTEVSIGFAAVTVAAYAAIASFALPADDGQVLVTRLLILAAVAICGNMYWRIERDRRQAAAKVMEELNPVVREEVAAA
jgi:hypothetical protein